MIIAEIPSGIWNFDYGNLPITRDGITVNEYLLDNGIAWVQGDIKCADFRVYKDENIRNGLVSPRRIKSEWQKRVSGVPYMNLNGESQEWSPLSYAIADPEKTYAVAPGEKFNRLYLPVPWVDPELDGWNDRLDKICWIGRPLPERLALAKQLRELGIPFDVYSREPWGIPEWKGYAEDKHEISRKYKYQIVYENSLKNQYHSEKLINSILCGCITFYKSDHELWLSHLVGSFRPLDTWYIENRDLLVDQTLKELKRTVFGKRWEKYSYKHFFDMIIGEARRQTLQ